MAGGGADITGSAAGVECLVFELSNIADRGAGEGLATAPGGGGGMNCAPEGIVNGFYVHVEQKNDIQ